MRTVIFKKLELQSPKKCQFFISLFVAFRSTNERFKEVVRNIQKKAECGHIWDFRSFILLPMQRVTRLKLLMGNILHAMTKANISEEEVRYKLSMRALNALILVLQDAETEQGLMTQKEHLLTLTNQLDWSAKVSGCYFCKSSAFEIQMQRCV